MGGIDDGWERHIGFEFQRVHVGLQGFTARRAALASTRWLLGFHKWR